MLFVLGITSITLASVAVAGVTVRITVTMANITTAVTAIMAGVAVLILTIRTIRITFVATALFTAERFFCWLGLRPSCGSSARGQRAAWDTARRPWLDALD